jgi:hypothetical protein
MCNAREVARSRRALLLAALQAGDLVATQLSPAYGTQHLDHLGVPAGLRPLLPVTKAAATLALTITAYRPSRRRLVGAALLSYYSAAATFHVLTGDRPRELAPAVACGVLAASLIVADEERDTPPES